MVCPLLLLHNHIRLIVFKHGEKTARRWLKKLGLVFSRFKKGIYFDGHERSDVVVVVVEFRKKFLEDTAEINITEKPIQISFIPVDARK